MPQRSFHVLDDEWITLADGTRLAARLFMPDGAETDPVPAILEFLPYRKRDGTSQRDESTYPGLAAAGYAGVRVDMRGSGESDGVIDGEYTERELADAVEIIDWLTRQPWCTGAVGMMGISWGGFNALQVAALKPHGLKAVISIASTTDRYNDDIHYKNGCQLAANLSWAATVLAYQSRSPDPALVGEHWRAMWTERLEGQEFFLEEWLSHQTRDAFWKHGSIGEDFAGYDVPTLVIAGWADGYRNTPLKLLEGVAGPAKAMIGPWVHKYPHFAWPKPRADFVGEAVRWWDRWLKDIDNGADALPDVRAYILDGPRPGGFRAFDPGRWVAVDDWSPPQLHDFVLAGGRLTEAPDADRTSSRDGGRLALSTAQDVGVTAGEYFTLKPDAEMAGDQRIDDARSAVFETAPATEAMEWLGQPRLTLRLASDSPAANLAARLVDVHPDGTATRIAFGVLNLTHRHSHERPSPLPVGEDVAIAMRLDACGYRLAPGHRLRLALSTTYWPMILPSADRATLDLDLASLTLSMPRLQSARPVDVAEPDDPDPLPTYIAHRAPETRRSVEYDLTSGLTRYHIHEDNGLNEHPDTGLSANQVRTETWSIAPDDPLSLVGETRWTTHNERPGWSVSTESRTRLSVTRDDWLISAELIAYEGETEIHRKSWERRIARDLM